MGRPYKMDLELLPTTYRRCYDFDIAYLEKVVGGFSMHSLVTVGSGGAFSAASFVSTLHESHAGKMSIALTPLMVMARGLLIRDQACLLFSAGGRNPDILGAFRYVLAQEPRCLAVCTFEPSSPLMVEARRYEFVDTIIPTVLERKDGFLATNSLLAFSMLFARAYESTYKTQIKLPPTLEEILHGRKKRDVTKFFTQQVRNLCEKVSKRDTIFVLHGASTFHAAQDLESRCIESALSNVTISDFRNFAHGRHNWLSKRKSTTAVIAFVTPSDSRLAERILSQLPKGIPILRISIPYDEWVGGLSAIVHGIHLAGVLGEFKNVDPGKPKVALFGRKIYRMRTFGLTKNSVSNLDIAKVAISRKRSTVSTVLSGTYDKPDWEKYYEEFSRNLTSTRFDSIAFDYDGTLCGSRERFVGISLNIASHMNRLLESGISIGVATGRGGSVREDLRNKISEPYWKSVLIGYYNGAQLGSLVNKNMPMKDSNPEKSLSYILDALKSHPVNDGVDNIRVYPTQISLIPKRGVPTEAIYQICNELIQSCGQVGNSVVVSSHSVDILAMGVTKLRVVDGLKQEHPRGKAESWKCLCIGDQGAFPGNDCAFLTLQYSLSVDTVSADPQSCWNLAPIGTRGVSGTLHYLEAIQLSGKQFTLSSELLLGHEL